MRPLFIVLDGPDGSGTTKQCQLLVENLQKIGISVHSAAEPTNGPIGQWIRTILRQGDTIDPAALQLLFCADRAEHQKEIRKALQEGKTVICDRYATSTIAYGEALGIDSAWLAEMNRAFIQPDILLFTLPPLSICKERVAKRMQKDSLEEDHLQNKVYKAYERLAKADPSIHLIDTSKSKEENAKDVLHIVQAVH
ncbi:dTMP kinase [Candidatus Peribacteria bacterium RIFCSPHIGHO2_01_FULL_51_9]|nr:MAG: dTMP kinase [Candidatus Peribacteria bacterium RIFCSPHIGHO2_01_FULL_51_9]